MAGEEVMLHNFFSWQTKFCRATSLNGNRFPKKGTVSQKYGFALSVNIGMQNHIGLYLMSFEKKQHLLYHNVVLDFSISVF
jgi:hypothetical protein